LFAPALLRGGLFFGAPSAFGVDAAGARPQFARGPQSRMGIAGC